MIIKHWSNSIFTFEVGNGLIWSNATINSSELIKKLDLFQIGRAFEFYFNLQHLHRFFIVYIFYVAKYSYVVGLKLLVFKLMKTYSVIYDQFYML